MFRKIFPLLLSVMCSCTVYKDYKLNVLLSPDIQTPTNITNIVFLNKKKDINSSNKYVFFAEGKLINDTTNYSPVSYSAYYDGFYDNMSDLFAVDSIFQVDISGRSSLVKSDDSVDWSFVDNICKQTKSQLLINVSDARIINSYDIEYYEESLSYLDSKSIFKSTWSLYVPFSHKLLNVCVSSDSLFYSDEASSRRALISKIPLLKDIVYDAAYSMGASYAKKLSPQWQSLNRKYFVTSEKRMMAADYFVQAGEWPSAIKLWSSIITENNKHLSALALVNLALAYEVGKDLDKALYFARKSVLYSNKFKKKYKEYVYINRYLASLEYLYASDKKLNEFLGR